MKASDAMIVWNWDDAGDYTGPKPQIDVVQNDEDAKKWRWCSRLILNYKPSLELEEHWKQSILHLFHDLTVLWGIPVDDVTRAFLKIDEYDTLFLGDHFPYRKNERKETTCQTL